MGTVFRYLGVFLSGLLLVSAAHGASAPIEEYFIVAGEDTILVGSDIESYSRTSYQLELTDDGYTKWSRYENQRPPKGKTLPEHTLLTDREFTIVYAGVVVAEGHIISGTESHLHSGLVLWDSHASQKKSRLVFGYFRLDPNMSPDPRETDLFVDYFITHGKLAD